MNKHLKEKVTHGTKSYPYCQYHIQNIGTYQSQNLDIPFHWHDEFEIIYILEGTLHLCVGSDTYTAKPGDIYLINIHELHAMNSSDLNLHVYTILFPLEFISFLSFDDIDNQFFKPLRNRQILFHNKLTNNFTFSLSHYLDELVETNEKKNPDYQFQTKIILLQFFSQLLYGENTYYKEALPKAQAIRQKEILAYINDHFTEKLTLSDLAEKFHMSEKYFSRYFSNEYHISFSRYIILLRLRYAAHLLDETDQPITTIALECGFTNVSYFIRSFHSAFGLSPNQYRKGDVTLPNW